MRKVFLAVAIVAALVVPVVAAAATLSNGQGSNCGGGVGIYHFVNNHTGGAGPGVLTATFTDGVQTTGPSKVLASTQHFYVESQGTLVTAETNLPGRLVLSDFACDHTPKK